MNIAQACLADHPTSCDGRLEVRTAADGTADAATVRMQQENVHLRTTVERTAAELRQLRDSRRAEPDRASLEPVYVETVTVLSTLPPSDSYSKKL